MRVKAYGLREVHQWCFTLPSAIERQTTRSDVETPDFPTQCTVGPVLPNGFSLAGPIPWIFDIGARLRVMYKAANVLYRGVGRVRVSL